MTTRPIRLLGDPVLRSPCEPVTSFDENLRALVRDLLDTVRGGPGRAAVAANQIGVPLRVFAWDIEGGHGHLVNPALELGAEIEEDEEGCLSLPGLSFPTPRAFRATAHGYDQDGAPITVSGTGMLARVLQHETGHLDGQLYVDALRGPVRRQALHEIRAATWAAPTPATGRRSG